MEAARSILWGHRDKQGWPLTSDTQIKQQRVVIHSLRQRPQRPRCFFLSRARLRPNCLGADLASCSSWAGK